jgi:hypothetical protein
MICRRSQSPETLEGGSYGRPLAPSRLDPSPRVSKHRGCDRAPSTVFWLMRPGRMAGVSTHPPVSGCARCWAVGMPSQGEGRGGGVWESDVTPARRSTGRRTVRLYGSRSKSEESIALGRGTAEACGQPRTLPMSRPTLRLGRGVASSPFGSCPGVLVPPPGSCRRRGGRGRRQQRPPRRSSFHRSPRGSGGASGPQPADVGADPCGRSAASARARLRG